MNTINLEDQNHIDDLRIQRAISGLTEKQFAELRELVSRQTTDCDQAATPDDELDAEFSEFEHCVAIVDVWLASDSNVTLDSQHRLRLLDEFAGGSPDRNLAAKHQRRSPVRRWLLPAVVAAATLGLAFASTTWMNSSRLPQPQSSDVLVSAAELRKQMLENPPDDLVRWPWQNASELESANPFLGDVIWSDFLQQGFALMNVSSPIADPALYQLQLFQQLDSESAEGVLCCEFRFDGYSAPFVVMIRPESAVSDPQRFTVRRSPDEPPETAGPNVNEEITLIAEAAAPANANAVTDDDSAVISGEQTTTF